MPWWPPRPASRSLRRKRLEAIVRAWPADPGPVLDAINAQCLDAQRRARGVPLEAHRREWYRAHLQFTTERFGELASTALWQGALRMLAGDRAAAYGLFRHARDLAEPHGGLARLYMGAWSIRPHETLFDWALAEPGRWPPGVAKEPQWKHGPGVQRADGPVTLFGSDTAYFKAFAADLVEDLNGKASTAHLHFHVVGWDAHCDELLAALRRAYAGPISASTEPYRYGTDYTYFATVRFLRAHQLLTRFGRAVYITDIDNRYRVRPESLFPALCGFDAGFKMVPAGRLFPWWGPSAGNLFLNSTPLGLQTARLLHAYVRRHFQPARYPRSWWFDQLALNELLAYLETAHADIRIVDLWQKDFELTEARPPAEVSTRKIKRGASGRHRRPGRVARRGERRAACPSRRPRADTGMR